MLRSLPFVLETVDALMGLMFNFEMIKVSCRES